MEQATAVSLQRPNVGFGLARRLSMPFVVLVVLAALWPFKLPTRGQGGSSQRFPYDAPTTLRSSAGVGATRFIELAENGALLQDSALLKRICIGEQLDIHIDHVGWVTALLRDHCAAGARLEFVAEGAMRERLVRHAQAALAGAVS